MQTFGCVLLIDCHSMPSVGGPMDCDPGARRYDFVLGDCFGVSCAPVVTDLVEQTLVNLGYTVRRNIPYAGGYTTRHYGRPKTQQHALQIEINRGLYMDETEITPGAGFDRLAGDLTRLMETLMQIDVRCLKTL
jgi:N-formylglutamate amidohydrolase